MRVLSRVMQQLRKHWMLAIAAFAALISMLLVPLDGAYLDYFDWKTIGCLFCVLAVASALRRAGMFDFAARAVIVRFESLRMLTMTLVVTTAVFSMVFTNDVALVIMLPLSVATLVGLDQLRLVPVVFALQALAANLCGMVMPFGNPQNLYLFSYFQLDLLEFVVTMLPPFFLSTAGIIALTWMLTGRYADNLTKRSSPPVMQEAKLDRPRLVVYLLLFTVTLLSVFRVVPYGIAVILVAFALMLADRGALARVDYPLLGTFLCFFIFAGNMARIPELGFFVGSLMSQWGLLTSALTSQVISNVPAAVLLSHFTETWQPLLVGVNIGGAGTFVGSLASLIAIRYFMIARTMVPALREEGAPKLGAFLRFFAIINGGFFIVLLVFSQLIYG